MMQTTGSALKVKQVIKLLPVESPQDQHIGIGARRSTFKVRSRSFMTEEVGHALPMRP
jgi:hypothetical protein